MPPTNRVSGWRMVATILAVGLVANAAIGVLPFAPFEGDELGIITGLREILLGPAGFPELGYLYDLQPGTYQIMRALHLVLDVDVGTLYFATSAAAAAMFAFLAAWLGGRLLRVPLGWCIVAVALAQEAFTAAAYANSSTIGGCLVLSALVLLELRPDRRGWRLTAGGLIALGGWCRFDALALAPLALVLLARKRSIGGAAKATGAIAFTSMVALLALLLASGVRPWTIWHIFQAKPPSAGFAPALASLYLLHSATGLTLAGVGLAWSVFRRNYWLPAAVASVFIPLFLIHGRNFDSTKYFYYGVPVLTWCAIWSVAQLWGVAHRAPRAGPIAKTRLARWLVGAAALAMFLEYFTSVRRIDNPGHRWQPNTNVRLLRFSSPGNAEWEWNLGAGDSLTSGDGFRVRLGYGLSPWLWHTEKRTVLRESTRFHDVLAECEQATVVTSTYFSYRIAVQLARSLGYQPGEVTHPNPGNQSTDSRLWHNGRRTIQLSLVNHTGYRFTEFRQIIAQAKYSPVFFACDLGARYAQSLMACDPHPWRRLSSEPDGVLLLYRRE